MCKNVFPYLPYVNFENFEERDFAEADPIGLLNKYPDGAVFDEIQRAPKLVSYIQEIVDRKKDCLFVLTGSQQFAVTQSINQSLAGRTAVLKLLQKNYLRTNQR